VAAGVVQARFLPAAIPAIAGLEFSALYVPAQHGGVGGDWYDVFVVPSGHVWVVTGDVRGHDLTAAAVMTRLRGTIQAYAFEGGRPAEVLSRTDRELEHFEPDEMATVVCAVLEPPFDRMRVCLAGHPPPVLAVPGRPSVLIDPPVGPPLGVVPGAVRTALDFEFPAGGVLFCYTDGLIEQPGEALDVSLRRLQSAITATEPEAVCQGAMQALVGARIPHDDIAAVAVRRRPVP
jgi:serine phosphatase RsbU (regulator of sigma subunit)